MGLTYFKRLRMEIDLMGRELASVRPGDWHCHVAWMTIGY